LLKNVSKKKIIIPKHKLCEGADQAIGLMFSLKKNFNYALIFDRKEETKIGAAIHMFFVFYPINILFLNSKKEVVDIKENLKPFFMYTPKKKARYIIELPTSVDLKGVKLRDIVSWC